MVEMLDLQEDERVLDPACGTGGFLRETLKHLLERWKQEETATGDSDSTQALLSHQARLARFAQNNLFGADFDPFLVRAASMNLLLLANTTENVFHMDSLAFPQGHLPGAEPPPAAPQSPCVMSLVTIRATAPSPTRTPAPGS